jgi:SNF2 family DNA or RNA helicase
MMDLSSLPHDFRSLLASPPHGFSVSERIIDPVLIIHLESNRFSVRLGGRRVVRGESHLYEAPTQSHAWVADGSVIRPLPWDAPELLRKALGELDPNDIPYTTALNLMRSPPEGLRVEAASAVLCSGRIAAENQPENIEVEGLRANLLPYQAKGVRWMWQTISRTGGAILADEMGLGKTLQVIALLLMDKPDVSSPALVLCPTSLLANWEREFVKFTSGLSYHVHRGPHRAGIYRDLQVSSVVITTYETMVNDIALFTSFEWSWLICDEAQAIKNPNSNRRHAVAMIPRRRTIPITGTPIENTLRDLWSLSDLAIPGVLGELNEFECEFPDTVEAGHALAKLTDPIILKRRVRDVAADLPERIDIDLPLELDEGLAEAYARVRETTIAKYPVAGGLVATMQLQLFCAHPWLRIPRDQVRDWEEAPIEALQGVPLLTPKVERVIDLLREAFINGRKVIIFSLFNRVGDLIRAAQDHMNQVWWGAINGSTPQDERQSIVDLFSANEGPACLVLNPKAAGAGLNITAATVVIHFTPVWNPALEAQASARAHRRGQTEPVTIYRMFYKNTVEEIMIDRSKWKSDLANETVPASTRDAHDLRRALEISPVRPS